MKNIIYQRDLRLYDMRNDGGLAKERFISCLKNKFDEPDINKVLEFLSFAENLDYKHEGLSPKSYLAHSCRVASLIMEHIECIDTNIIETALVHNIFEVSPDTANSVEEKLGVEQILCLKTLTINRNQQSDSEYLASYYQAICESSEMARIIKVFDKLDNMFIVCIYPDEEIRLGYFKEIQEHVIPLLRLVKPELEDFFLDVIKDTKALGHIPL